MLEEYCCLIPLRAGSKGVRGKNLKLLSGLPLYQHTTDQALRLNIDAYISTDISELLETPPAGIRILSRPQELASDYTEMSAVIAHFIKSTASENKKIILLQATSPLRNDEDVLNAINLFKKSEFDTVLSVTKADQTVLKMGHLSGSRYLPLSNPEYCFTNRQQLPETYKPNGAVFVFSASDFVLNSNRIPTGNLGAIEMPYERSIDLDNVCDFEIAERILISQSDWN